MYLLCPCLDPFNSREEKLLKAKISEKTAAFQLKNLENLGKLSTKSIFWPKMDTNCPLRPSRRVNRNSHIAYNRTINL